MQVDAGSGCVEPTTETVQSGEYKPLSRPLFIYPSKQAAARPEVKAFLDYYIGNVAELAEQAQFVPMTEEQQSKAQQTLDTLAGGA